MNNPEEIRRLLNEILPQKEVVVLGEVLSVSNETCSVLLSTGLEYPDVRLRQAIDESPNYFIKYPKVGAKATMISLSGDLSDLMLISASEYISIAYEQDGLEFKIDSEEGTVLLKKNGVSLFGLFDSLSTILKNLQVGTGTGPSTTPLPLTMQGLIAFESDLKSILKN